MALLYPKIEARQRSQTKQVGSELWLHYYSLVDVKTIVLTLQESLGFYMTDLDCFHTTNFIHLKQRVFAGYSIQEKVINNYLIFKTL